MEKQNTQENFKYLTLEELDKQINTMTLEELESQAQYFRNCKSFVDSQSKQLTGVNKVKMDEISAKYDVAIKKLENAIQKIQSMMQQG